MKGKIQNLIRNWKLDIRNSGGFTLVEMLVVIVVLIATGSIIGAILSTSLRTATKTQTITNMKQNGNYAITQLAKEIRNAEKFKAVSPDGTTYGGCPATSSPQYHYIRITSFGTGTETERQTTFICPYTIPGTPPASTVGIQRGTAATPQSLLDTSVVTLNSCHFTCIQKNPDDPPTISIYFSLNPKTTSTFTEQTSPPLNFQTTIRVRNK